MGGGGGNISPPHLCVQCLMAAGKVMGACWESCDGGRNETGHTVTLMTFSQTNKNYIRLVI